MERSWIKKRGGGKDFHGLELYGVKVSKKKGE
jgi:hypothetical protein